VAFPAISTGVYGYPLEEAAPISVASVTGADTDVKEVRFVLFDRRAYDMFADAKVAVEERFPTPAKDGSAWDVAGAVLQFWETRSPEVRRKPM
jgi:hypothetical protein